LGREGRGPEVYLHLCTRPHSHLHTTLHLNKAWWPCNFSKDVAVAQNKRGGRLYLCSRWRYMESLSYTASEVVERDGSSPEPRGGLESSTRRRGCATCRRIEMSTEDVAIAEKRWGGRGATARRNRIAKACCVQISAEDVAIAELRWCDEGANEGGENSACAAHPEKKIVPYRAYGARPCLEHPVRTKRDSTKSAPISRQQGPQAVCEWQERRGKCSNRSRRMNADMHAERTACGEWQKQWSLRHKAGTDRSIGKHSR
jgi:hypothetical protein